MNEFQHPEFEHVEDLTQAEYAELAEMESEPIHPVFTGKVQIIEYSPHGRSLWKRLWWYTRHPRITVARLARLDNVR
jgi:hypothetical protein